MFRSANFFGKRINPPKGGAPAICSGSTQVVLKIPNKPKLVVAKDHHMVHVFNGKVLTNSDIILFQRFEFRGNRGARKTI